MMIPKTLRELNISNNPVLSQEAYKVIGEVLLEDASYKLEKLIMEGCKLND